MLDRLVRRAIFTHTYRVVLELGLLHGLIIISTYLTAEVYAHTVPRGCARVYTWSMHARARARGQLRITAGHARVLACRLNYGLRTELQFAYPP